MKIKNNSRKRIIYFAWQLEFPETATSGNVMAFQAAYGPSRFRKPTDYENQNPIAAGDAFEVGLTPKKFEQLKAFIGKRHSLKSLTKADIRILDIHYDDGTGWTSGVANETGSTESRPIHPCGALTRRYLRSANSCFIGRFSYADAS